MYLGDGGLPDACIVRHCSKSIQKREKRTGKAKE